MFAKPWYDFVLQQMAAESYFEGVDRNNPTQVNAALRAGNNRTGFPELGLTRMTARQATEFSDAFRVIHHASDNATQTRTGAVYYEGMPVLANSGLSATLIQRLGTNEFTLSIRSTENKSWSDGGDRPRDLVGAGIGGILRNGFALAQIAALEDYFVWLKSSGTLPSGAVVNVSGYSLGGHLATVFTELHAAEISQTVTFNAPGRGRWSRADATLAQIVDYYRSVVADPRMAASIGSTSSNNGLFSRALSAFNNSLPLNSRSIYDDPRHQWANEATRQRYGLTYDWGVDLNRTAGLDSAAAAKITQIYGLELPSTRLAVANSGIHGPATGVFVEAQPFVEGNALYLVGNADFGNAHSIVLLSDSLALMRAYQTLAPAISLEMLNNIFGAFSHRAPANAIIGSGQRARAEDDPLEAALDSLRRIFTGADIVPTPFMEGGSGFADPLSRNNFYENLSALTADTRFTAWSGQLTIESLAGKTATQVVELARGDIAYRYALRNALPFTLTGAPGLYDQHNQNGDLALFDPLTGTGNATEQWLADRSEMLVRKLRINQQNVAFESADGNQSIRFEDFQTGERILALTTNAVASTGSLGRSPDQFAEVAFRYDQARGNSRNILFGKDNNGSIQETLSGERLNDRLYGGNGNDLLQGLAGNDYLEGGADEDTLSGGDGDDTLAGGKGDDDRLQGGLGVDTYRWNVGDGTDVIVDAVESSGPYAGKRAGVISFAGAEDLSGTKTLVSLGDDKLFRDVAGNRYQLLGEQGKDGILTIRPATGEGGLRILGFKDGDFGISLSTLGFNPPQLTDVLGTFADNDFFSLDASHTDSLSASAPDQRVLGLDGDDRIKVSWANAVAMGGLGADVLLNGPDDQQLFGEEGNDILLSSAGNDELDGGVGDDVLQGGVGDDYLVGGPEDVSVVSSTESDHDLIDGGLGSDVIFGGDGNDFLVGGGNLVPTIGVLNGDHTQYSYGYKRQLDGSMRIEGMAGYDITVENPFQIIGVVGPFVDGYFNVDGDLADFIDAGAGNDFVFAGDGDDVVLGGSGADSLVGQIGDDYVEGGTGNDTLMGDGSRDSLLLDSGVNLVYAFDQFHGADTLVGNEGDDVLIGDGGADELYGDEDDDILIGDAPADKLDIAYHGDDYLDGGSGNDFLYGYGKNDTLVGGEGNDRLEGDGTPSAVPYANHGDDYLDGEAGDDTLVGGGGADQLYGGDGNDTLAGDADDVPAQYQGADYLDGEAGDDVLQGYGGDDTLVAGAGDDTLAGGKDNDRYLVNLGAGADTIIDGSGTNTVVFGAGISQASLTLTQGLDPQGLGYLVINYSGSDSLAIQGGFNGIQLFEFADGKKLSPFTLYQMLASTSALPAVSGGGGNDTLPTGPLSQVALGGSGNDTYTVSRSSGWSRISDQTGASDRVLFDASVTPDQVRYLRRVNGDLEVEVLDAEDPSSVSTRVTVGGQFLGGENRIETFEFGDGTVVQASDLDVLPVSELEGTAADDELVGDLFIGQTFSAGEGSDTLAGGSGDDVYRYAKGDGIDVITDNGGSDRIEFAAGVAREDVLVERKVNEDLVLTLDDGGSITIAGQFVDPSNPGIDEIRFADGTTIDAAELAATPVTPEFGTDDADTMSGGQSDDTLYGLGGDDTIAGGLGADTIVAGAGDDILDGASGSDTLIGGEGNDSYRFGYGTGNDAIVESAGESSAIDLAPGIGFADLRAVRTDDDLAITLRGTGNSLSVRDYFAAPQEITLYDAGGASSTVQALLDASANELLDRESLKADARSAARADFFAYWLAQGLHIVDGTTLAADRYPVMAANFSQTFETITTTTTTAGGSTSTQVEHVVLNDWTSISTGAVLHTSAHVTSDLIESDDEAISLGSGESAQQAVTQGWAQLAWQQKNVQNGFSHREDVFPFNGGTIRFDYDDTFHTGLAIGTASAVPGGVTPVASPPDTLFPHFASVSHVAVTNTRTIQEVLAGPGENTIIGGDIVDGGNGDDLIVADGLVLGGAGNDQLFGRGSLYGEDGNDQLIRTDALADPSVPTVLDGGAGDDTIAGNAGNDTIVGGSGADSMDGISGSDRYVVAAAETGVDSLADSGIDALAYLNWYYLDHGILDWEERARHSNEWRLEEDGADVFYYKTEAEADAAILADNLFNKTLIVELDDAAPVLTRDDPFYDQLIAAGVLSQDVLEFGPGLSLEDLDISVQVDSFSAQDHPERPWINGGRVSIRWGADDGVDFDAPGLHYGYEGVDLLRGGSTLEDPGDGSWHGYRLGRGIEAFLFADGTSLRIDELLANAAVVPGPENFVFRPDAGYQLIDRRYPAIECTDGILAGDIQVTRDGRDLLLSGRGTQGRLRGWYDDPDAMPQTSLLFEFDPALDASALTALGLEVHGTFRPETLHGMDGFSDRLFGAFGDDVLVGGSGDDFLQGDEGDDSLDGGIGTDTYAFKAGDGFDTIADSPQEQDGSDASVIQFGEAVNPGLVGIGLGSLVVLYGDGDAIHFTAFDAGDPYAMRVFDRMEFADGSTILYEDLLANGFYLTGTEGDDVISGTGVYDQIFGNGGNDSLYGGGGNDDLYGGEGDDTLSGGPGDSDVLVGEEGADTFVYAAGDGWDEVYEWDETPGEVDRVQLQGFDVANVRVTRNPWNYYLVMDGGDRLTLGDMPLEAAAVVERIEFEDGTVWTPEDLEARVELLPATEGEDILWGTSGNDSISGLGGVDELYGNGGDDMLAGGEGEDFYYFAAGDGHDTVDNVDTDGSYDSIQFADAASTDVALSRSGSDLVFTAGADSIALAGWYADANRRIDSIFFEVDGGIWDAAMIEQLAPVGGNSAPQVASPLADRSFEAGTAFTFLVPSNTFSDADASDVITLSASMYDGSALPAWFTFDPASGAFTGIPQNSNIGISHVAVTAVDTSGASAVSDFGLLVHAMAGSSVTGGSGNDVIYGGAGDETLVAKGGSDYLYGDVGDDLLRGGGGEDVLQGGEGSDVLRGGAGQNVLDGGAGDDLIYGGQGAGFIAGGAGDDVLRVGRGNDVFAFNTGDGMDTVYGGRDGGNTLSFGGGIRYSDLSLSKSGKDLVVSAGGGDGVVLKNWYGGNHSVLGLQIILDATEEFDASSSDSLYNRRVQTFDFQGMVSTFDAARAESPGLTSWAVTNALLQFHLSGADDAAIGGDLAYWYGKNGGFTGISLSAAQQVIGAPGFGSEAQSLRPFSGLQEGLIKLG